MNNLFKLILTSLFLVILNTESIARDTLPAITENDYVKWQTLYWVSKSVNGSWPISNFSPAEGDDIL